MTGAPRDDPQTERRRVERYLGLDIRKASIDRSMERLPLQRSSSSTSCIFSSCHFSPFRGRERRRETLSQSINHFSRIHQHQPLNQKTRRPGDGDGVTEEQHVISLFLCFFINLLILLCNLQVRFFCHHKR